MKKINNKGFTLVELLVTIVILGVVVGMSFPIIRAIKESNEKREYSTYSSSILSSSKLYVNSYDEDLFGHSKTGCAIITYKMLNEKKLIKDIDLKDISCNSDNTFIKVVKLDGHYSYSSFLGCGQESGGKAKNINVILPESKTAHVANTTSCAGADGNSVIIEVIPEKSDSNYKKKKNAIVRLTSSTGIKNNVKIQYTWSKNKNYTGIIGLTDVEFSIPSEKNQKNTIEKTGNDIVVNSNKIYTPNNENGSFYLILKIDSLMDLGNYPWQGTSNYLSFGPFNIDNTPPTVPNVTYLKWKDLTTDPASKGKTGTTTYTPNTFSTVQVYVEPNGSTDNLSGLDHYEYTITGVETNASNKSATYKNITTFGTSKIKWRACDKATNCSNYTTEEIVKISYLPSSPTVNFYNWSNNSTKPTSGSGLSEYTPNTWSAIKVLSVPSGGGTYKSYYQYTTTGATTNNSDTTATYRNIEANGESKIKWRSCNSDDLCSDYTSDYSVKIDTVKPTISNLDVKSSNSNYNNKTVTVTFTGSDNVTSDANLKMCISETSTCTDYVKYSNSSSFTFSGSYNGASKTLYVYLKDEVGNVQSDSKNYTLYKTCSKTVDNGSATCGGYGACSAACGGGVQYATKTQPKKDEYLGTACDSVVTANGCSKSCNTQTCSTCKGKTIAIIVDNSTSMGSAVDDAIDTATQIANDYEAGKVNVYEYKEGKKTYTEGLNKSADAYIYIGDFEWGHGGTTDEAAHSNSAGKNIYCIGMGDHFDEDHMWEICTGTIDDFDENACA